MNAFNTPGNAYKTTAIENAPLTDAQIARAKKAGAVYYTYSLWAANKDSKYILDENQQEIFFLKKTANGYICKK